MTEITTNTTNTSDATGHCSITKGMTKAVNEPVYKHFNQVKQVIQGVEAIDYFFAKEMNTALTLGKVLDEGQQKNLFHMFLALSASLRAGHSCLPLSEIAEQHWAKGFPVQSTAVSASISEQSDDSDNSAQAKNEELAATQQLTEQQVTLSHAGFVFAPLTQLQALLTGLAIQATDQQLLVLNNDNLYLRRYFYFETELEQAITLRLAPQGHYDNDHIEQCITALFPNEPSLASGQHNEAPLEIDWQKIAVANAINKNFSVIAGGPGTGKTYTVTKLLAALLMLEQTSLTAKNEQEHRPRQSALNIALVAPTGKAAQRLSESIINAVSGFKGLIDDNILAEIPTQAQTIHRLLGVLPNSPNFRHHEDNRLAYDVVLIDEVSMVDLPLMTRIFRALKDNAKVILLGDADQLPSVAAGSVLADIAPRPHGGYSLDNEKYLNQVCQLSNNQISEAFSGQSQYSDGKSKVDYLSFLMKSRRFDGKGGIGLIANSVIRGDVKSSWQLLKNSQESQSSTSQHSPSQLTLAQGELGSWLAPLVKQYYQPIEYCASVSDAFDLLAQFRVLCATRKGDYGVESINEVIKGYLGKNNAPFQQNQQVLYHGQPIMINENDYRLGLYNGDIGILWRVFDQTGKAHLMACFEDSAEAGSTANTQTDTNTDSKGDRQVNTDETPQPGIRKILPSRLPKFESVYAMTIHKTQGSEFSHVAMVLSATVSEPHKAQRGSKLLSRELLYTGITRAKKQLTIAANQRIWQQGVTAQVKRHSGLRLSTKQEKC
ncbi:exodeoxyribonuclease V subunit alpha [Colwellia piezophila]|uniref:exodeoxyribonuclease V subunit alpha n=1 Tax=Colwellia piezophila TaxID=211668 RepID=UPI0003611243|nr:exodeoxyribonuclease V subunit alpha [Colwellia piezophila]